MRTWRARTVLKRSNGLRALWVLASLTWVVGLGVGTFWSHEAEREWLNYWADSIEWVVNADPTVPVSAKQVRAKLGDEAFIAAAPSLYPQVNLQETLRRYEADKANRPPHEHVNASFVLWALVPPVGLYGLGIVVGWIAGVLIRRGASEQSAE